jgi:hypothetical protein
MLRHLCSGMIGTDKKWYMDPSPVIVAQIFL